LSFQKASAQTTPTPMPTPKKVIIPTTPGPRTPSGVTPTVKPGTPLPRPLPTPPRDAKRVVENEAATPAEKSIATESKVNITVCVKEGNVTVNGWDRDEIRAYVADGSEVGFKTVQDNPRTKKPVWVYVLGFDPKKTKEIKPEECLSGSDIELDVPRNATVNLESRESAIKIESVAKVSVKTLSGGIYLNDIAGGIEATTYEGDLMVEKSGGQIILGNTAGNIIALDVAPREIGDIFKAKTNSGRITLKGVEHRQIETGTISGSTSFDGALLNGGQYGFSTQNGSIILAAPIESLCKINAWFGFGAFASEMPLENVLKKEQSISAQMGTGEPTCSLNLKTGSGAIRIRKSVTENKEPEIKEKSRNELNKINKPLSLDTSNVDCPVLAPALDLNIAVDIPVLVSDAVFTSPEIKIKEGKIKKDKKRQ
jgi:hypothetical protein